MTRHFLVHAHELFSFLTKAFLFLFFNLIYEKQPYIYLVVELFKEHIFFYRMFG